MQKKKHVIACISLLAGSLVALSGTMAQATSTAGDSVTGAVSTPAVTAADALYVAPGGSDDAAGTEADPTTLSSAISRVTSGGTVYLRGGMVTVSPYSYVPPRR